MPFSLTIFSLIVFSILVAFLIHFTVSKVSKTPLELEAEGILVPILSRAKNCPDNYYQHATCSFVLEGIKFEICRYRPLPSVLIIDGVRVDSDYLVGLIDGKFGPMRFNEYRKRESYRKQSDLEKLRSMRNKKEAS